MLKETNVNTGKGVMPERRTIQKMGRRTREEKNYRRKVVKDVLLNSLLKAVVVPAATAAAELTPWHWLATGFVVGSVAKNLAEKEERPHLERIPYERPHYERPHYERPRRDWEDA